jgi:hypothetical protein
MKTKGTSYSMPFVMDRGHRMTVKNFANYNRYSQASPSVSSNNILCSFITNTSSLGHELFCVSDNTPLLCCVWHDKYILGTEKYIFSHELHSYDYLHSIRFGQCLSCGTHFLNTKIIMLYCPQNNQHTKEKKYKLYKVWPCCYLAIVDQSNIIQQSIYLYFVSLSVLRKVGPG